MGQYDKPRRDNYGEKKQMFKASCNSCGNSCQLPFKPTGSKPVYCSDCFEKMGHKSGGSDRDSRGGEKRYSKGPSYGRDDNRSSSYGNRDSGRSSYGGGRDDNRSSYGNNRSTGGGSYNRSSGDRDARPEMFEATCDSCGEYCKVPFRPSGDKDVYCSDCFEKRSGRESRGKTSFDTGPIAKSHQISQEQFDTLNKKLDLVIEALSKVIPRETKASEEGEQTFELKERKTVRVEEKEPLSLK